MYNNIEKPHNNSYSSIGKKQSDLKKKWVEDLNKQIHPKKIYDGQLRDEKIPTSLILRKMQVKTRITSHTC